MHCCRARPTLRQPRGSRCVRPAPFRRTARRCRAGNNPPPLPPPPPPFPSSDDDESSSASQPQFAASNGFSWPTFKENIRPYISYIAFTVGLLTVGLDTASKNFVLQEDPVNFIGTALMSAGIVTAATWVTFNFEQDPPPDRRF